MQAEQVTRILSKILAQRDEIPDDQIESMIDIALDSPKKKQGRPKKEKEDAGENPE